MGTMERVLHLEMHLVKIGKVAQLEGMKDTKRFSIASESQLGAVTADLEMQPLMRATLETVKELDLSLQNLLIYDKPQKDVLMEDIAALKKDLAEKDSLTAETQRFIDSLESRLAE